MNETEFYQVLGQKISLINEQLFNNPNPPSEDELKEIKLAVTFLHDHKYRLLNQGLNQIEYIINEAREKIKGLEDTDNQ